MDTIRRDLKLEYIAIPATTTSLNTGSGIRKILRGHKKKVALRQAFNIMVANKKAFHFRFE